MKPGTIVKFIQAGELAVIYAEPLIAPEGVYRLLMVGEPERYVDAYEGELEEQSPFQVSPLQQSKTIVTLQAIIKIMVEQDEKWPF